MVEFESAAAFLAHKADDHAGLSAQASAETNMPCSMCNCSR
jgi:hypothetical protein